MSLMNRRMLPSVIFVALSLSFAVFTAGILRVYAAPSFTVEANPTTLGPLAAGSGQTADSTITVTGHDGFVGTVSLSFPPSGLTESSTISSCSLDHSVLVTVISPATVLVVPRSQLLTSTGATVVYNVNVVSMPPFAGYDIMVVTNPNVLSPDSIDTSASALNPGTAFTNCVNNGFYANGTAIPLGSPGNINCGPGDGPGVAHSGFSASGEFTGDGMRSS